MDSCTMVMEILQSKIYDRTVSSLKRLNYLRILNFLKFFELTVIFQTNVLEKDTYKNLRPSISYLEALKRKDE